MFLFRLKIITNNDFALKIIDYYLIIVLAELLVLVEL